jgi:hypothetical protein
MVFATLHMTIFHPARYLGQQGEEVGSPDKQIEESILLQTAENFPPLPMTGQFPPPQKPSDVALAPNINRAPGSDLLSNLDILGYKWLRKSKGVYIPHIPPTQSQKGLKPVQNGMYNAVF